MCCSCRAIRLLVTAPLLGVSGSCASQPYPLVARLIVSHPGSTGGVFKAYLCAVNAVLVHELCNYGRVLQPVHVVF
jgi:hypothetical protein